MTISLLFLRKAIGSTAAIGHPEFVVWLYSQITQFSFSKFLWSTEEMSGWEISMDDNRKTISYLHPLDNNALFNLPERVYLNTLDNNALSNPSETSKILFPATCIIYNDEMKFR